MLCMLHTKANENYCNYRGMSTHHHINCLWHIACCNECVTVAHLDIRRPWQTHRVGLYAVTISTARRHPYDGYHTCTIGTWNIYWMVRGTIRINPVNNRYYMAINGIVWHVWLITTKPCAWLCIQLQDQNASIATSSCTRLLDSDLESESTIVSSLGLGLDLVSKFFTAGFLCLDLGSKFFIAGWPDLDLSTLCSGLWQSGLCTTSLTLWNLTFDLDVLPFGYPGSWLISMDSGVFEAKNFKYWSSARGEAVFSSDKLLD